MLQPSRRHLHRLEISAGLADDRNAGIERRVNLHSNGFHAMLVAMLLKQGCYNLDLAVIELMTIWIDLATISGLSF